MGWQVQTIDRVGADDLVDVFEGRVAAIRIPGYCPPDVAARIAEFLVEHPDRATYQAHWVQDTRDSGQGVPIDATDVDRVGKVDNSFRKTADNQSDVVDHMRAVRAAAAPALGPMDLLRLELDEIAPGGAGLFRRNGRVSLAGIGRIMESSQEIVHADVGRRDCLTANVYLRLPARGGATRIWDYDGDYRQSTSSYKFAPGEIPESAPSCLLEPAVGDLVIWNPVLPHVVLAFDDPPRVSLQSWLLLDSPANRSEFAIRLLN